MYPCVIKKETWVFTPPPYVTKLHYVSSYHNSKADCFWRRIWFWIISNDIMTRMFIHGEIAPASFKSRHCKKNIAKNMRTSYLFPGNHHERKSKCLLYCIYEYYSFLFSGILSCLGTAVIHSWQLGVCHWGGY